MKKYASLVILCFVTSVVFSDTQKIITILDFKTSGISEQEMSLFVDYLASSINNYDQYKVIDRQQREIILSEARFSNSGCADDSCAIEIGQLLSANEMIVGSLGSIGELYLLNSKLIDVASGQIINNVSRRYETLEELVIESDSLISELFNDPLNRQGINKPQVTQITSQPSSSANKTNINRLNNGSYLWKGESYRSDQYWGHYLNLVNNVTNETAYDKKLLDLQIDYTNKINEGMTNHNLGLLTCGLGAAVCATGIISGSEDLAIPAFVLGSGGIIGGLVMVIIGGGQTLGTPKEFINYYNTNNPF